VHNFRDLRYITVQYVSDPESLESTYKPGEYYDQSVVTVRDIQGTELEMVFNGKSAPYATILEKSKVVHF